MFTVSVYKVLIIRALQAKEQKSLFLAGDSIGEILKILQGEYVGRKLIYRTIQRYKKTGSLKHRLEVAVRVL